MSTSDVLVLNNTFEPLDVVGLQRAVRLLFARKAEIVAQHARTIASAGNAVTHEVIAFPLPSIIRLLYYVNRKRRGVALTKKNVLLRDSYRCQYCSIRGGSDMTVDHVQPKSRGGSSTWENLVCACVRCNNRKNNRTPAEANMTLRSKPRRPSYIPWLVIKRHTLPDEWGRYFTLYGVSIDERVE